MRYEEQELSSFKHCMKVNQRKSAWNARRNENKSPELQSFVMVLTPLEHIKPALEDLQRGFQSVVVRGLINPVGR